MLCDRCALAMADVGDFDIEHIKLRGARLLIDKVAAVGSRDEHRVSDHIYAPGGHERTRRTYGIEGIVISVGPDLDPEISVGDRVIIDEFAGRPLWWNGRLLPYWIVGESEVMVAITP